MKKKIKWMAVIVILGAISYGLYQFGNPSKSDMAANTAEEQITFPVTQETLINTIEIKGKSSYEQETIVYAPFTGKVKQWNVKDAQQVKKGELLFNLDPSDLQKEIAQSEASLKKMKLEDQLSEFQASIGEEGEVSATTEAESKKQFIDKEAAKLQRELNQVNLSIQEQEISDKRSKVETAIYYAPTDGIFLYDDAANLPQYVQENARIGKIVDTKKLQLVSLVGEQDIFMIKPGMPVDVKINALKDVPLKGTVTKVSKFAKPGTDQAANQAAQFEVIISLEANENMIAGLSLTGLVETSRIENAIVVPTIAVMKDQEGSYVMLKLPDGSTERRSIKTGMETPEKTEVLTGLQPGDTVVLQ
ncbi:efflux RND transporter periplasmic adaptor subunit [Paenibacillus marinisediminis]